MPPVSIRTRLRRTGLLPWLLIGPAVPLFAATVFCTVADRLAPWPEAHLAVAERKPLLVVCTALNSLSERDAGVLTGGVRVRGYALLLRGGRPSYVLVSQTLPAGRLEALDNPGPLFTPAFALLSFLVGTLLLLSRLRSAFRMAPPGAIPPILIPPLPAGSRGRSESPLISTALYPAGYFAAWFALISLLGHLVLAFASSAPEGQVSAFHESFLVSALLVFFSLSLLSSWALSIVLWIVLSRRAPQSVLTVVLLSCSGYLWSFAYLFVTLPRIRPKTPPRGA